MAGRPRVQKEAEVVAPDADFITDDPRTPSGPNFALQMVMDLTRAQTAVTQNLAALSKSVEKQGDKLGRIDDLRVDIKELSTKVGALTEDLRETKTRLDKVRTFVIGATAVVAVLILIGQIAIRFAPWPATQALQQQPAAVPAVAQR